MTKAGQFRLTLADWTITRQTTPADVRAIVDPEAIILRDMDNGYVWLDLPAMADTGVSVGASLGFWHGQLEAISLSDTDPTFGANWDDWSEAKEKRRAESIGSWLTGKGLPPGPYGWGSVWCGYDSRGGGGSATIRLNKCPDEA